MKEEIQNPGDKNTEVIRLCDAPCSAYSTGAWFLMNYGSGRYKFYITETAGPEFRLSKRGWCVSRGDWFTRQRMEKSYYNPIYLGHGKLKWYWRWLPWRDLVVPFTQPND